MKLLDRYIFRQFINAYLGFFISLFLLFIVVDLFLKMDEFSENADSFTEIVRTMGIYYLYRAPWIFDRLSSIVALLAAMFTLGWMERQNELLPILSAGIPARRILFPIVIGLVFVVGLGVLNRETLVPLCKIHLQRDADDPDGSKYQFVRGGFDSQLIHFEGGIADPEHQAVDSARVTLPPQVAGRLIHLSCERMQYREGNQLEDRGWYLINTTPSIQDPLPTLLIPQPTPGTYFLRTDMSFSQLIRDPNWFYFEPTYELLNQLQESNHFQRRIEVVTLLHKRLTAPILDLILVLMGVALIMGRIGKNIYIKLGMGLILYALFEGSQFLATYLTQSEWLSPALAAWFPVLIFGPFLLVLYDSMRS